MGSWAGGLAGWLAGCLAGWLAGWLAGSLAGWLAGWQVGWLASRAFAQEIHQFLDDLEAQFGNVGVMFRHPKNAKKWAASENFFWSFGPPNLSIRLHFFSPGCSWYQMTTV